MLLVDMGTQRKRHIIGCMTGTSLDGLDVVLAEVVGAGREITARYIGMASRQLGELRDELAYFACGNPAEPIRYLRAARLLGNLHADVIGDLLKQYNDATIDFVVAHGQTICHAPHEHLSWQLFDPWPIIRRLNVPVLHDLRQADLAAGGQGAPITPLADWILYRRHTEVVANLGGICNITSFSSETDGFDLCPCNLLIDRVVQRVYPQMTFDRDGQCAAQGRAELKVFKPIFEVSALQREKHRSLGREDLTDQTIDDAMDRWRDRLSANDLIASAVASVAEIIGTAVAALGGGRVVLAGGAARNHTLVECIRRRCDGFATIRLSDELGIPCEAREAMGLAVLGVLSEDGVPITLPHVTGSKKPGPAGAKVPAAGWQ